MSNVMVLAIELLCGVDRLRNFIVNLCYSKHKFVADAAMEATTNFMMKERRF